MKHDSHDDMTVPVQHQPDDDAAKKRLQDARSYVQRACPDDAQLILETLGLADA